MTLADAAHIAPLSFQHPSSKTLSVPDDVRRIFRRLRRKSNGIPNTFWCACRTILVRRVDRYARERGQLSDRSRRLHDDWRKRIAFRTVYSASVGDVVLLEEAPCDAGDDGYVALHDLLNVVCSLKWFTGRLCEGHVKGFHLMSISLPLDRRANNKSRAQQQLTLLSGCLLLKNTHSPSKGIDMLDRHWMTIYMNNNIHYGEWLRCKAFRAFKCYLWQMGLCW